MSLPEISKASVYTDFNGLAELRHQAGANSREALEAVAKQFESIFTQMMLKSMREAQLAEGIFDSNETQTYMEMYDKQLATSLSTGAAGIGLAKMLVQQLGQNLPAADTSQSTASLPSRAPVPFTQALGVASNTPTEKVRDDAAVPSERDFQPGSPESFIETMRPHAQAAAQKLGVDPRLLLAQAGLETGWGRSVISHSDGRSSHNLFNIKAGSSWNGESVGKRTLEYHNGVAVQEMAAFRSYDSYGQSFADYAKFIGESPRYREALQKASDSQGYIHSLQEAGYATDPAYARKILNILGSEPFTKVNDTLA